jgi:hypothetical protein
VYICGIAEGQIMYRVYMICSERKQCMSVGFQLVNHVSSFLGRYRSIQADR